MRMFRDFHRRQNQAVSGQAATEYLILIGMVLMAFTGIAAVFSNQVRNYLSLLFELIELPF
jgi:hypothetical protein